ncbi:Uncharacterised protein [Chlamydia trachomatis]|nr:Uncharacterised protein [Chlamydia trachomatis]
MNTTKQRSMSFILAIIFFIIPITSLVISSRNLSNAEEISNQNKIFRKTIPIEVDGKIFSIDVESNLPFYENYNSDKPVLTSLYPDYPVGTKRYFTFNITREALGLTSGASEVSIRVLSKVTNKLLAKAIPGIGWISIAAIVGAGAMYVCGVTGLKVSLELEYVEHYYNMGGYYVYAWDLNSANIEPY